MTRPAHSFDHALVRDPGLSVLDGLRMIDRGAPSFEALVAEHGAYVRALEAAGVVVERLPPLEAFPDSVFVEDPALVFPEGAIVLRPGAPTRFEEASVLAVSLRRRFEVVVEMPDTGSADGGDVLALADRVVIGLSARTTVEGAAALAVCLARFGRRAEVVRVPEGVLHLKSDCAALDDVTVLATARLAQSGVFRGSRVLVVPKGEEAGANALRVNEVVLVGEEYPRTAAMLSAEGYSVVKLAVTEIAKLDAGLSCMSLRWRGA